MPVLQCGFVASVPGEPGCSKDISSAKPIPVSQDVVRLTKIFNGGWGFGIAATEDNKLYMWGVNAATMLAKGGSADDGSDPTTLDQVTDNVELAVGGFDHCAIVQDGSLSILAALDGKLVPRAITPAVIAVSAGEHHTLILTSSGDVYALGSNSDGQLGVSTVTDSTDTPVLVFGPSMGGGERAVKVAAGARHSVIATESGKVYTFGCSLHGQCGTGSVVPKLTTPTLVDALGPLKCVDVAAGMAHSLVLSDSGDIYAFGSNTDGQLGDGTTTSSLKPKLVEALGNEGDSVVKIVAGGRHNVALYASGAAFSWGYGSFGQLGNGKNEESGTRPERVSVGESVKVVDVAAGWWHTLLLVE